MAIKTAIPMRSFSQKRVRGRNSLLSSQWRAPFPAAIEDCKCAVRFLRANASKYGIDPERIGVAGSSAGGHLAELVATANQSAGLEGDGGWHDVSSRVQAAASYFGLSDLTAQFPPDHRPGHPKVLSEVPRKKSRSCIGKPVLFYTCRKTIRRCCWFTVKMTMEFHLSSPPAWPRPTADSACPSSLLL